MWSCLNPSKHEISWRALCKLYNSCSLFCKVYVIEYLLYVIQGDLEKKRMLFRAFTHTCTKRKIDREWGMKEKKNLNSSSCLKFNLWYGSISIVTSGLCWIVQGVFDDLSITFLSQRNLIRTMVLLAFHICYLMKLWNRIHVCAVVLKLHKTLTCQCPVVCFDFYTTLHWRLC